MNAGTLDKTVADLAAQTQSIKIIKYLRGRGLINLARLALFRLSFSRASSHDLFIRRPVQREFYPRRARSLDKSKVLDFCEKTKRKEELPIHRRRLVTDGVATKSAFYP